MIEQVKFAYFPLGKAFVKQIKTIWYQTEKQIKALQEHDNKLVKYKNEKESLIYSKQKFFRELATTKIEQIQI